MPQDVLRNSKRHQSLDQLNLPGVIDRVTRDAEDEAKALVVGHRPTRALDRVCELRLVVADQLRNPGPGEPALFIQREPVLAGQGERRWCAAAQLRGNRPRAPRMVNGNLGDVVATGRWPLKSVLVSDVRQRSG